MSFKKREIEVTITLGQGKFGEQIGDTVTLRGHRVKFQGEYNGGVEQSRAQVMIYGLPMDMLNRLTAIGPVASELRAQNKIRVDAGNEGEALNTVYIGSIMSAYAQYDQVPDVPLVIDAYSAMLAALKPVQPSSYAGTVNAEDCMADFAKEMGFSFENNGVSVSLSNPYFDGTTLTKVKECAQAARINYSTDNEVLAVWPRRGGYRKGTVPRISPDNGMIGYPSFGSSYIGVKTLFRPELIQGGRFQIEGSEVTPANGTWGVYSVRHTLESETPNGAWFTEVQGFQTLV